MEREAQENPFIAAGAIPAEEWEAAGFRPIEPADQAPVAPERIPLSTPKSGTVLTSTARKCIAPFEIHAPANKNVLVKLRNSYGDEEQMMTIFVRKGETTKVDVPLGVYRLTYATGDDWYGYQTEDLFGTQTSCSKADKLFLFSRDEDGISGHEITLYTIRNGNLETSHIPRSQF